MIFCGCQYPDEPPIISIVDSKGLDDVRQNQLIASIRDKAIELSSCLMLVALCEVIFCFTARKRLPCFAQIVVII